MGEFDSDGDSFSLNIPDNIKSLSNLLHLDIYVNSLSLYTFFPTCQWIYIETAYDPEVGLLGGLLPLVYVLDTAENVLLWECFIVGNTRDGYSGFQCSSFETINGTNNCAEKYIELRQEQCRDLLLRHR